MDYFENLKIDFRDVIVLLDIDGCLVADGNSEVSNQIRKKIEEIKQNNKIFLCSNKRKEKRDSRLENILGLKIINKNYKKPSKKILREIPNYQNQPIVVIGDKVLTDGVFAKRINSRFISVERKLDKKDTFLTKTTYLVDDIFYSIFHSLGIF